MNSFKANLSRYSALLFDCDGTLADSMPAHLRAWNQALRHWDASITKEQNQMWAGQPTKDIVHRLNKVLNKGMPPDEVDRLKEKYYLALIDTVKSVSFVEALVHEFHGQKSMAVVSGSPRESVLRTLKHLGLLAKFQTVVAAGDYKVGKPAPDCYLLAAEELKVRASECLVLEDADLGVEAAKAAGMRWLRVDAETGFDLSKSSL